MRRTLNWKFLLWTLGTLLLVGVVVHFVHGLQVRRSASSLLEQADRAKSGGDIGQAVIFYRHYLDCQPEDTAATTKLALALDQQANSPGDWERVAATFEDILRREPGRSDLRKRLVINLIQLGRLREAIANIQTLLPQSTDKAELEHMLGWCQEAIGDYAKAAAAFTRAIALDPSRQASYVILAEVLRDRLDQADEAAKVMDALVQANGRSFSAYLARFNYLRPSPAALAPGQDRMAAAERDLHKALELGPNEPAVLLAAAEWAQAKGDLKAARDWLRQGLEAAPHSLAIVKALANLDMDTGRRAEAVALLTSALQDMPQAFELHSLLDFAHFEDALHAGQLDKAAMLLDDLHRLEGDQGKLWRFATAALLVHDGASNPQRLNQARQDLEQLARLYNNWDRVPLLQAAIEESNGNLDKAIVHYLRAVDLGAKQPRDVSRVLQLLMRFRRDLDAEHVLHKVEAETVLAPEVLRLGAEIALANQNIPQTLRLATHAASPTSADYRDLLWLGRIYHSSGVDAKAEAVLRRAVALAPQTPDTWIALAQHLARAGKRLEAHMIVFQAKTKVAPQLALFTQARCFESMGLTDQAALLYRQGLAEQDDDISLLVHAADFFRHADQPAQAEPFLRALLNRTSVPAPYLTRARRQLAVIVAKKGGGELASALELIDANLKSHPTSCADLRARAFILAGQPSGRSQAIRVFEETAHRQPLSTDEQLELAQLQGAAGEQARGREQFVTLLTNQPDNAQAIAGYISALLTDDDTDDARAQLRKLERLEPGSRRTRDLKEKVSRTADKALP